MIPLVTITDFTAVESLSINTSYAMKLRPAIFAAQKYDLKPLVGEEFFNDILTIFPTPTPAFNALFNETSYTYNGHTYTHPGLKMVLIGYAYARYKVDAGVHDTATGPVQKLNNFSNPVDGQTVSRQIKIAIAGAEADWRDVERYLDRNKTLYPLWRMGCADRKRMTGNGSRIRKVVPKR